MLKYWVDGSEKVQNYTDVIYGWSPILIGTTRNIFSYAFTLQGGMKTKFFVFKKAADLINNCNYNSEDVCQSNQGKIYR